jgi:pantoate--beta-alanine ligase
MRIVNTIAAMQRLSRHWRGQGLAIGFVPTMGYLHAGHVSLVEHARKVIGPSGKLVVSIYVNPTQFGPGEDFNRYPRDLKRDARMCRKAGVDIIFAPSNGQMYPGNGEPFSTFVIEEKLSQGLESASRPTHFRGVTTVVAKLFNIVQPQVAVFGAKDYQQAQVVKRMVRDLNFPVKIIVAPTLRESDGLAMSSRNKYLAGGLRTKASVLWHALQKARAAVRSAHGPIPASRLGADLKRMIEQVPAARLDYLEFFEPETLLPVSRVTRGTHLALAVRMGKTRLIDNARLV